MVVYSIVRTESGFDQRDKSPTNAVGLMQVNRSAKRKTASRRSLRNPIQGVLTKRLRYPLNFFQLFSCAP